MAYASMLGGGYGATASVIPNAHGDTVSVPDAELLFNGDFRRAGPDLVLTGHDGRHHLIAGYFSGEKKPALVAPNGASLSPDLVDLLAGSPTPGQYAQAQQTTPPEAIGKVEKAIGNVTAIRNGVAVALHVGDPVFKSDVIQTGANSSAGIGFPDGTALNLIANTRMALNDYSYDPNGTSNVALVSLVQGTFAFVAGRVAHTGDMKIETPVATMGIRGTTGWVQEIATVTANVGNVTYSFAVVDDFNSTGHGQYDLIDANGNIIATVSQTGYVTFVTPQGPGVPPLVSTEPMTNSQLGFEQQIIQQVFGVLNSINNPNPNPQSTPGTPGSGTPPNQLNELPHLLQEGAGQPFAVNIPVPGSPGTTVPGTVTISTTTQQTGTNSPTATVSWISTTGGDWNDSANWSDGLAPLGWENVDITLPVKVTIDDVEQAASLVIGPGGILNIIAGGELIVANGISNSGVIQLNSSGGDPQLVIDGTVYLLDGGTIEFKGPAAQNVITGFAGSGATLVNVDNTIEGSGVIGQGDGHLTLVNGGLGTIDATPLIAGDSGVLTINTGNTVSNSGLMEATAGGTLQIDDAINNLGTIKADGGTVNIAESTNAGFQNSGLIEAINGGAGFITGYQSNASGGVIEAIGAGSTVSINVTDGDATNYGLVEAVGGGTINLTTYVTVNLNGDGGNFGTNEAVDGGTFNIMGGLPNFGITEAVGADATVNFDGGAIINTGTIAADGGGAINIDNSTIYNSNVYSYIFDGNIVDGLVEVGAGSHIYLDNASILQGFVTVAAGGEIDTVAGTSNTIDTANGPTHNTSVATITIDGTVVVNDNSSLTLASPYNIENAGNIELDSTGHQTFLYFNQPDPILSGTGSIVLEGGAGSQDIIAGVAGQNFTTVNLDNQGNTISGAGAIGQSGGVLVFTNDIGGTINADLNGQTLTIETHSTFTNNALMEATNGGILVVDDSVTGTGSATISGGGILELGGADAQAVTFAGAGTLQLEGSSSFTGTVSGLAPGDIIDLASTTVTTAAWDGTTLTLNGTKTAFAISGLPAGDTLFFTPDNGGSGTDLTVEAVPTVTIGTIETNNVVNANEAAAGFTVSGTASDSSVAVNGQTVTVDIVNSSDVVVHSYAPTITNGNWSVTVPSSDSLADGTYTVTANLSDAAINPATAEATHTLTVNEDKGEQAALKLTVTDTDIGASAAAAVPFTIAGLESDDTGTVTFTDHAGNTIVVDVSGGTTSYNANLTSLDDGTITSSLAVATDPAGNSFNPVAGNTVTLDTEVPVITVPTVAPAGFFFTPDAATLDALEGNTGFFSFSGLAKNEQIGTFTEAGGNAGDTYTFTIGGTDSNFSTSAGTDLESLSTGNHAVGGGFSGETVYALTVTVTDTTTGTNTGALPFDVVVGSSGNNTINLESGPDNLGISAATPTIVYGLNGNDTINAAGMTAPVWFVGGAGSDTMTGGSGLNTYLFAAVSESGTPNEVGNSSASGTDTITNFNAAKDLISFAAMSGITAVQGLISGSSTVNADSIAWIQQGSDVIVYANTDSNSHHQDSHSGFESEIILSTASNSDAATLAADLSAANFILSNVNAGQPSIAGSGAQTIGLGQAADISGVSLSETGATGAETFTVILTDSTGVLSATATGGGDTVNGNAVSGSGTSLTIFGTLSEVNADLSTLTDTNDTAGTDNITVTASDMFGNAATSQTIDVTVAGLPVITAASPQTVGVGKASPIAVGLSETNATSTETFTVTLTDTTGTLSATGGTWDPTDHTLTISGTLSQVTADLGTLTDTDSKTGVDADTITVSATDGFGNSTATPTTIDVTVNGPAITAPATATVGENLATAITGVSIADSDSSYPFTVTLTDAHGLLSANMSVTGGGGTISGSGTDDLTIKGTLSQVNADLTTLKDTDGTLGSDSDTITLTATDSAGDNASQQIDVTVNGLPSITVPEAQSVAPNTTIAIAGVGLSETGNINGETFTVTLTDSNTNGDLSATGTGVSGSGTHELTVSGSLAQVNSDLATLTDKESASDTITVTATDSLGNSATAQTVDVTVSSTADDWSNASGGDWSSYPTNWTNGTPGSNTNAYIQLDDTYTVAINDSVNIHSLTISDPNATVTDYGNTLTLSGLTIDAGATFDGSGEISGTVVNNGMIDASVSGSTLQITGNITGSGSLDIENGAKLELGGTSTNTVTFEGSTGTLQIDSSGSSTAFSLEGGGNKLSINDVIDLPNIKFDGAADSYNASTDVITVSDGHGHTVTIDVVGGIGNGNTFTFSKDTSGGTELVDPPATGASSPSVSIGGPGNDNFIFRSGLGADTGVFKSQNDTQEFGHFTAAQIQQWSSFVSNDGHDAIADFVHHSDGVAPSAFWHAALHGAWQLH